MKVLFPAAIVKIETLGDRTIKVVQHVSKELPAEESAKLFSLAHNEGWSLFSSDDNVTEADVPNEKPDPMTGSKTQAQRLRGVIYRIWEQKGKPGDSESFYRTYMERLIDREKSNLE